MRHGPVCPGARRHAGGAAVEPRAVREPLHRLPVTTLPVTTVPVTTVPVTTLPVTVFPVTVRPVIQKCHVDPFTSFLRSSVRTVLDHMFDFRTFERACLTIERGTDNSGPSPARQSTDRRRVKITADTLEHMFDNPRYSG